MEFVKLEIRMGGRELIWLGIYGQVVGSFDNSNKIRVSYCENFLSYQSAIRFSRITLLRDACLFFSFYDCFDYVEVSANAECTILNTIKCT
jgi:hypothetical protein